MREAAVGEAQEEVVDEGVCFFLEGSAKAMGEILFHEAQAAMGVHVKQIVCGQAIQAVAVVDQPCIDQGLKLLFGEMGRLFEDGSDLRKRERIRCKDRQEVLVLEEERFFDLALDMEESALAGVVVGGLCEIGCDGGGRRCRRKVSGGIGGGGRIGGGGEKVGCIGFLPRLGVMLTKAVLVELILIEFELGGGFGDLAVCAEAEEIAHLGLCASAAEELHTEPKEMIEAACNALVIALVGGEFVQKLP